MKKVAILPFFFFFLYSLLYILNPIWAHAEVFSSTNFRILDPILDTTSGYSTSTSFSLFQSIGQIGLGTSTASSFQLNSGFLTFPTTTIPVVTAAAGDGQVSLSWTAATGALGWTIGGYNVGQGTASSGPYTYTSTGSGLSSTRSGLTNGTTYYFVVRPEDAFGNSVATSSEVSATPVAAAETPTPSGGGGGPLGLIVNIARPLRVVPEVISPHEKRRAGLEIADLGKDGKVDLADLSVFLYYFGKPAKESKRIDLNRDGKVNLVDISILFYYWGV